MKRKLLLGLTLMITAVCAMAQEYNIPQESIRVRDPFITVDRTQGLYYLITAGRSEDAVALKAYESRDLEMWREVGYVYLGENGWIKGVKAGVDHWWAPDTYYYKGHYYTIVTLTNQKEGRVNFCTLLRGGRKPTDKYRDTWVEGKPISLTPYGQQCLDGSLFIDSDGQPWLVYSLEWNGAEVQNEIGETWAVRLRKNLKGTLGDPIRLFTAADSKWNKRQEDRKLVVDAPFLWRDERTGQLFCYWSSFVNGVYAVGRAVSATGNVAGPWVHDEQPFYMNGGHQMLFRDLQGRLRMSLHEDNNNAHLKILTLTE